MNNKKLNEMADKLREALKDAYTLQMDQHFTSDLAHLISTAEANRDNPVTVKELIDFLEKNFKPEDRLYYWHEGGAWMECEPVYKTDIGRNFLKTVSQDQSARVNDMSAYSSEMLKHDYRMVKNNDIVLY